MRVIVNIASDTAAEAAGWRARAVQILNKSEAPLYEVLNKIKLKSGATMSDLITGGENLKKGWILYINGNRHNGGSGLSNIIKDNVQIHIINERDKRETKSE